MQEIYGPVSKKVSPKISVPSRHIYQLMELQVQLPPGDRSFVEHWIVILRHYEKKQQGKPFAYFFLLQNVDTTLQSSDEFLSFLEHLHQDISQKDTTFDPKSFDENMSHYLGEFSDEQIPTRPVTNVHVDLLQSIRKCVDTAASRRPITNLITSIKLHLHEASTSTSSLAGT